MGDAQVHGGGAGNGGKAGTWGRIRYKWEQQRANGQLIGDDEQIGADGRTTARRWTSQHSRLEYIGADRSIFFCIDHSIWTVGRSRMAKKSRSE